MVEISRAGKEHTSQIMEVWREFIQCNIASEPLWNSGLNVEGDFEKTLKKKLKSDDALVLVALEQGRVVGFALAIIGNRQSIFRVPKVGTISDLGIKKEFRRQGIGKKMLVEIKAWFVKNDVSLIEVAVLAKNEVAASFWTKQEFQDFSHRMYRVMDSSDMS